MLCRSGLTCWNLNLKNVMPHGSAMNVAPTLFALWSWHNEHFIGVYYVLQSHTDGKGPFHSGLIDLTKQGNPILLITLTMTLFYSNIPVSHDCATVSFLHRMTGLATVTHYRVLHLYCDSRLYEFRPSPPFKLLWRGVYKSLLSADQKQSVKPWCLLQVFVHPHDTLVKVLHF